MKTVIVSLLVSNEYIRILSKLGYVIEYTLDESEATSEEELVELMLG